MISENFLIKQRLTPELISIISQLFEKVGATEEGINNAKKNWPQFRFILCSEYDMGERAAFLEGNHYSIFLIAASLGCAGLTYYPANAVGLVIATHEVE